MPSSLQAVYDRFDRLERRTQDELLCAMLGATQALRFVLPDDPEVLAFSVALIAEIAQRGHGSRLPPVQPSTA